MIRIEVRPDPFDAGALLADLGRSRAGGLASFIGIVRGEGGLTALRLDHYPGMTERMLQALAEEACRRWPLLDVTIWHRTGPLAPGDPIVFVGTASRHRAAALESCAFLIDRLKTEAPFWKHETFADGTGGWVAARASDDMAAARWQA